MQQKCVHIIDEHWTYLGPKEHWVRCITNVISKLFRKITSKYNKEKCVSIVGYVFYLATNCSKNISFSFIFELFKQTIQFLQKKIIQCWDPNPSPLELESSTPSSTFYLCIFTDLARCQNIRKRPKPGSSNTLTSVNCSEIFEYRSSRLGAKQRQNMSQFVSRWWGHLNILASNKFAKKSFLALPLSRLLRTVTA